MSENKSQAICKYYNRGFSKFKSDCNSYHSDTNCSNNSCKKKKKTAQIGTLRHVDTKTNAEEEVTACIAMKKGLSLKLLV